MDKLSPCVAGMQEWHPLLTSSRLIGLTGISTPSVYLPPWAACDEDKFACVRSNSAALVLKGFGLNALGVTMRQPIVSIPGKNIWPRRPLFQTAWVLGAPFCA